MVRYRPKIVLSAAISIDGKIATYTGNSNLSSNNNIKYIHKFRSQVDAILVGRKTIEKDDPLLTVRRVTGKSPTRIVLSTSGMIPIKSKIFQTAKKVPTILVCTEKISQKTLQRLEELSVVVMIAGKDSIDLKKLLSALYRRGIKSILLEGGGITNWEFISQNLVDEALITITPFMIGGSSSPSLVDGTGFPKIKNSPKLELKSVIRHKDELILCYKKI